jgi:hypothetical protein
MHPLYIISQTGLPLEMCKFDWSQFYRQCLRHPAGWWLSVYMTLSTGLVVDERLIMGDASCCHSGNWVETIQVLREKSVRNFLPANSVAD